MRPSVRRDVEPAPGWDPQAHHSSTCDGEAYPVNDRHNEGTHPSDLYTDHTDLATSNNVYGLSQHPSRQIQSQKISAVQGPAPKKPRKSRAKSSSKRRAAKTPDDSDDGGDEDADDAEGEGQRGAILPFIRGQPTTSKADAAARGIREREPLL
jgi:hypothetical protein